MTRRSGLPILLLLLGLIGPSRSPLHAALPSPCERDLIINSSVLTAMPLPDGGVVRLFSNSKVFGPARDQYASIHGLQLLTHAIPLVTPGVRRILVLGSGSGYEAIVLAQRSDAEIVACDISPAAIVTGELNARFHGLAHRIRFVESDLFEKVAGKFDLILFNAPRPVRFDWLRETCPDLTVAGYEIITAQTLFDRKRYDLEGQLLSRTLREVDRHLAPNASLLLMSDSHIGSIVPPHLEDQIISSEFQWASDQPENGTFVIHRLRQINP